MFLGTERRTLDELIPKLDEQLRDIPFDRLESRDSPVLSIFRELGGPSLLIPEDLGGRGAGPLEAARVHRAVGSRAPSLAIAMTMHNFTTATLVLYGFYGDDARLLLRAVADGNLLLASAVAEGRTGQSIFESSLRAEPAPGGYRLSGRKKPCSLTWSADILTATVTIADPESGEPRRAMAIVPASSPGIDRARFWGAPVLAAAESDELILRDVVVPESAVIFSENDAVLDPMEIGAFCWFELLVSASYLGIASGLAERALASGKGDASEIAALGVELEGAMNGLSGLARCMRDEGPSQALLPQALFVRYAVQGAIERAATRSAEILGGIAFVSSGDVGHLLAASRGLAFHPPSRIPSSAALVSYLREGEYTFS